MPYSDPVDRAKASGRYYWRKKHHEKVFDYDPKMDHDELRENYRRLMLEMRLKRKEPEDTESVTEREKAAYVQTRLFEGDLPYDPMVVRPAEYLHGVKGFFDSQDIMEEEEKKAHWSGLSDEAVERISEGTSPLLYDRDVDLMPIVADFNTYLEELEKRREERNEKKDRVWRFM